MYGQGGQSFRLHGAPKRRSGATAAARRGESKFDRRARSDATCLKTFRSSERHSGGPARITGVKPARRSLFGNIQHSTSNRRQFVFQMFPLTLGVECLMIFHFFASLTAARIPAATETPPQIRYGSAGEFV